MRSEKGESIHCSNRMFVSFIAARDISAHEPLVVPLESLPPPSPPSDNNDDDDSDGADRSEYNYRYTSHEFGSQCL